MTEYIKHHKSQENNLLQGTLCTSICRWSH